MFVMKSIKVALFAQFFELLIQAHDLLVFISPKTNSSFPFIGFVSDQKTCICVLKDECFDFPQL